MATIEAQGIGIAASGRKRRSGRMGIVATQVGILVVLLLLWKFLVTPANLPYFSRPTLIGAKLWELLTHHQIYRHISVTLSEIAIGYAMGAVFGLSLGFA